MARTALLIVTIGLAWLSYNLARAEEAAAVLAGLRKFYHQTARTDGSFSPGIDPDYRGMSDSVYSDLAAVTYACTIHKTFGWALPYEAKTIELLLARQRDDGSFVNVAGTVDPESAEGRCYNTTQALVSLHALGVKPRRDPLGVFEQIAKSEYESLPAYSTSFFPLAYLCCAQPIPPQVDRGIRATMVQASDGYLHDHIAATFHASHYYRLIGETTPLADKIVARILQDQKPDGSWLLNMPSRDRHATFDAVFTLRQEGANRDDCRQAIAKAAKWALSCRNQDSGFGHFPGSPSDADANYFQVGTLVMAEFLKPADPLPADPELLSWGHLMPLRENQGASKPEEDGGHQMPDWISGVAFSPDGRWLATACADNKARIIDKRWAVQQTFIGHDNAVVAVTFSPDSKTLATGSYDRTARLWDRASGRELHRLEGHRGAVMCVAFSPDGKSLATSGIDGDVRLWDSKTGKAGAVLQGHKSWVNAIAFVPDGSNLLSASSDGTIREWNIAARRELRKIEADKAEIRSLALSADGSLVAAGIRYGRVKTWDTETWQPRLDLKAHQGDVWSLAVSPDSHVLFTGDGDWDGPGEIKVWDTASGKELTAVDCPAEVLSLGLSKSGNKLAIGGREGLISVRGVSGADIGRP
jgi:hypothetical protein